MQRGFYTAASGMLTKQRTIDVISNNIVNSKTPGFRAGRVVTSAFNQELLTRIEGSNTEVIGEGSIMRVVKDVSTQFQPEALEETGIPYDLGIEGIGFFNISVGDEDEAKTFLTRNGHFDVDKDNNLVLPGKGLVLGEKGTIKLENSDFTVDAGGNIYDDRGRFVDRLLVTVPLEDAEIQQDANGMYFVEDMSSNVPAGSDTVIWQGSLERSNVDMNREYTLLMEAQRAFQACSSALQIMDKIDQKAASTIASL